MAISSLGIGSGIDIASLVNQLVAAQIGPQTARLDRKEAGIQARLSGFGALKGALSSFNSSLSGLQEASSFQGKKASSSDTDILTVSSSTAALAGNYDVTVTQLAAAHKLATDPSLTNAQFTATTDTLSTGTLTFKFGTTVYDKDTDIYTSFTQDADKPSSSVVITDASLQGIRDAVNDADIGVSASIIFDGNYQRLVFSSDSGAANSLEITVADDDGNNVDDSGLSLLAFNSTVTHMEQTADAQDTIASVNGINITSEKKTLTDVIDGVTLNILKVGTASIDVEVNKGAVSSAVSTFVFSYNSLINTINDLGAYDPDTGQSGILNGDSILRGVENQINRVLGKPVSGTGGAFGILAEIGITRDAKDGTMILDQGKLDSAIANNFDDIASLFSAFGKADDSLVTFDSSTEDTKVGNYAINITQLATQGTLLGSSAANLTITAGSNDSLSLTIDGVTAEITLSAGTYTAASLAVELQARVNGTSEFSSADISIKVSESAGVLTLTSNRYGSASNVEVTGGNGKADLVGSSATKTAGLDVAGTIGGIEATGSGQYLTATGEAKGLKLLIEGLDTGDRGSINFTRGYADQLGGLLNTMLGDDNIFDTIDQSLSDRVDRIGEQRERLEFRAGKLEERLLAQFIAMDTLISQLKNTGNFLTQQLESISKISIKKN